MEMNQKPWSIENARREMQYYINIKAELADLMAMYEKLLAIEAESLPKIDTKVEAEDPEDIAKKIAAGENLLDSRRINVDSVLFKEILREMAGVIAATNPEFKEPLDRLLAYPDLNVDTVGEKPLFIDNLLKFNTQYFTKIAQLLDINSDVLFFLIYHAISPFIEKASYEYRDTFDYKTWQKTTCPICGRKPSMAILRQEDGQNLLQCQVCRSQWVYPRVTCAVCSNSDNDTYKYFYDEADEAHRVYVCDKCKKYLKTTDCRQLDRDIDIEVEDLATLVLDFVAKERGYEPGGRITFAVGLDTPEDIDGPEMPVEIKVD